MANLQLSNLNPADVSLVPGTAEEVQYGGLGQGLGAAAEGAAGIVGGGFAENALAHGLNMPELGPEARAARARQHPIASALGGLGAAVGITSLTGGAAAPLTSGLADIGAAPVVATALGWGGEGALYGAANAVNEASLGDPNLNAQKVMTDIGIGGLTGAALGALSHGIKLSGIFGKSALKAEAATPKTLPNDVIPGLNTEAPPAGVEAGAITDPPPDFGMEPKSLADMAAKNKQAQYMGISTELPQAAALNDAASRLELEFPVHDLQSNSLESQATRDLYNTAKEMPGKTGDTLRQYEANQKFELNSQTDATIKSLNPSEPIADAVKGGNRTSELFTKQYQAEKNELAPIFNGLKSVETEDPFDHTAGVINAMTEKVPAVARMFDTAEDGALTVRPYNASWGIDKATYSAVKDAVGALQSEPSFMEELWNVRKSLDQHVDVLAQGQAPSEIRSIKAGMMDYMQSEMDKMAMLHPEGETANLRDAFKRYAINEQQRSVIEKVFGASVGRPEFGQISKIKPENINDNIFRNTASVTAAKHILGENFNEVLSNWLAEQRAKVTTDGVFSSNKFGSFLRRNEDALNVAFSDNPQPLQKIKDLNTVSRILPDAKSINPSGTAKTLIGSLSHLFHLEPGKALGNLIGVGKQGYDDYMTNQALNAVLSNRARQSAGMSTIKSMADRVTGGIQSGAKSIFSKTTNPYMPSAGVEIERAFRKNSKKVQELGNNPQALLDHLSDSSVALNEVAPNITQALHTGIATAINYLNSNIPAPQVQYAMDEDFTPSQTQMQAFNNRYAAVNNPLSVFKDIKHGFLSSEALEALQTVHPQLLQEMQQEVMSHMEPTQIRGMNYSAKIALSKFLGHPLDASLSPQSIMSNQTVFMTRNQSRAQSGQGKTTQGGLKELDLGSRSASETSQAESDTV